MSLISRFSVKIAATAMALGLGIGTALASGPVTVTPDPYVAPPPAPAFDWAGAYGGLSYSSVTSDLYVNGVLSATMPSQGSPGAFIGYNWQRGNIVFGGELSYTSFNGPYPPFVNRQRDAIELRARAGYAMDNVLAYGFVGAAQSSVFGVGVWNTQNGYSFGVGLQVHVGRNVFVGVEAARRDVQGPVPAGTARSVIDSVGLRVGYQF